MWIKESQLKEILDSYIKVAFGSYEQAGFKFKQFEVNYKRFFPSGRDAMVLDVGIGRGGRLTCMKNWGYKNYLGVDISPDTINFCKFLGLNCVLVEDAPAWLGDKKDTFELITLLDVLEHVRKEETVGFLKALRASLKDGGLLIIQTPNLQAPDGQLHRYNDFTHEVGYIEHSLQQVLMAAGFKDIKFGGFEEFTIGIWKEKILKVLRKLYWFYVKKTRLINGNMNPDILNPVFFAVAKK